MSLFYKAVKKLILTVCTITIFFSNTLVVYAYDYEDRGINETEVNENVSLSEEEIEDIRQELQDAEYINSSSNTDESIDDIETEDNEESDSLDDEDSDDAIETNNDEQLDENIEELPLMATPIGAGIVAATGAVGLFAYGTQVLTGGTKIATSITGNSLDGRQLSSTERANRALTGSLDVIGGIVGGAVSYNSMQSGIHTSKIIPSKNAKVLNTEKYNINPDDLKITNTVENHNNIRPYQNSSLLTREIINGSDPIPDPEDSVPNVLFWSTEGSYNGSLGKYELLIDNDTNTIMHFFKGGK